MKAGGPMADYNRPATTDGERLLRLQRMLIVGLVPMARDHNPHLFRAVVDLAAAEGLLSCECELRGLGDSSECIHEEPCPA
jgi:hypothetical protein